MTNKKDNIIIRASGVDVFYGDKQALQNIALEVP